MTIQLREADVLERCRQFLDDRRFRETLTHIVNDRLTLSFFLMSVSLGERLGEWAVMSIGEDEVARLMTELDRQRLEERGHSDGARLMAEELFPEFFRDGTYLYEGATLGGEYYFTVREANRRRLREQDRYSRLNLFITTTFAYEIMVELFYGAVLAVTPQSRLPREIRERVEFLLTLILEQEETHLGIIEKHNVLLGVDQSRLSPGAARAIAGLAQLQSADYELAAERAVQEIVGLIGAFAEPTALATFLEGRVTRRDRDAWIGRGSATVREAALQWRRAAH